MWEEPSAEAVRRSDYGMFNLHRRLKLSAQRQAVTVSYYGHIFERKHRNDKIRNSIMDLVEYVEIKLEKPKYVQNQPKTF